MLMHNPFSWPGKCLAVNLVNFECKKVEIYLNHPIKKISLHSIAIWWGYISNSIHTYRDSCRQTSLLHGNLAWTILIEGLHSSL